MPKFRKKPVVIDALQWTGENREEMIEFVNNEAVVGIEWIAIPTLEGTMRATVGDYIIRGVHGELYSCKPDIFAKTYEKVD